MRWLSLPALLGWFAVSTVAIAQPLVYGLPQPRLEVVTPCGGQLGSTIEELTLAGTDLTDCEQLRFSHPGIKAEFVPAPAPKLDPKVKAGGDKMSKSSTPAAGKFRVTINADVPVGIYDVRAVNAGGISNPRAFMVGDRPEFMEKEPNNDVPEAQRLELDSVMHGTINTTSDVDYVVFAAKKGQRVLASVLAYSLDSQARPKVEIYDPAGRQLAGDFNYAGNGTCNDSLADVRIPADGDYYVRISDVTYTQGGNRNFYRLSLGTGPWIDAVHPMMVVPGKPTQITLYGRNLPGGVPDPEAKSDGKPLETLTVTVTAPADAVGKLAVTGRADPRGALGDGFEYRVKGPIGMSNPIFIALADAPVTLEKEGNDRMEDAMPLPAPCEIAGKINQRADRDWYKLSAKKGESWVIDLWSERLGTRADVYYVIRKAKSTDILTEQDDTDLILSTTQFYSRSADPAPFKLTVTEDADYLIQVASRDGNFLYGPRAGYRLRVTPEIPDYRLVVMPSTTYLAEATTLRADGDQVFDVFAHRVDGFNGAIQLEVANLPTGVTCPPGQVVNPGSKHAALVLRTSANAKPTEGPIQVRGTAMIHGKPVTRDARPATITWGGTQAGNNTPYISRLDRGLFVSVRETALFRIELDTAKAYVKPGELLGDNLMVKPGDKLTVPYRVIRGPEAKQPITLSSVMLGNVQPVTVNQGQPLPAIPPDKDEGTFIIDVKLASPAGPYSLALRATMATAQQKKDGNNRIQAAILSTTPIAFTVSPTKLGTFTADKPAGQWKLGSEQTVVVRVIRENDYAGAYQLKVTPPPSVTNITVSDVTIPAGKNEATLTFKVAMNATGSSTANEFIIKGEGLADGKFPITSETKLIVGLDKTSKK